MKSKLEYDYKQRLDEYMLELLAEAEMVAAEQWSRSQAWPSIWDGLGSSRQKSGESTSPETKQELAQLSFPIVKPEDIF